MSRSTLGGFACVACIVAAATPAFLAQEYKTNLRADHPAIRYLERPVNDPVQKLARALERGDVALRTRSDALGYLPDLLERLQIQADSQMLVFSKTSGQAPRISPSHPRALYFADEVVVAYVPGAPTVELAGLDPIQGPILYAMSVDGAGKPTFTRSETCLRCHQGPNTAGVAGIYVGSVIPGPSGAPLRGDSAIITDHRTPFKDRWGGWYVTARRGEQPDRANAVALNPAEPEALVRESQQNLVSLIGRFDSANYLAQTSDIVALMTFEHQTQMTNLMTRVAWETRIAQDEAKGADGSSAAAQNAVEDLVAYMLFSDEAPLKEPIEGVSSFTRTFPQRGPRDRRGRSLRDFDLQTRLFRYPLSYMVYSAAFDALPDAARNHVYRRLHEILSGADRTVTDAHLSKDDRRAILEILMDTKPNLPAYWRGAV